MKGKKALWETTRARGISRAEIRGFGRDGKSRRRKGYSLGSQVWNCRRCSIRREIHKSESFDFSFFFSARKAGKMVLEYSRVSGDVFSDVSPPSSLFFCGCLHIALIARCSWELYGRPPQPFEALETRDTRVIRNAPRIRQRCGSSSLLYAINKMNSTDCCVLCRLAFYDAIANSVRD